MFAAIHQLLARRREQAEAIDAAVGYFENARNRRAHRGISSVLHSDELGFVVRVCYDNIKPPQRAWFRVLREGRGVEELEFDEVKRYGERLWR